MRKERDKKVNEGRKEGRVARKGKGGEWSKKTVRKGDQKRRNKNTEEKGES